MNNLNYILGSGVVMSSGSECGVHPGEDAEKLVEQEQSPLPHLAR